MDIPFLRKGYKCAYASRQKENRGASKLKVRAIFKNDRETSEQWGAAMDLRRAGISPKEAPTPSVDTDTTVTHETDVEGESGGIYSFPVRAYKPEMGDPIEIAHRNVRSAGKVGPRHLLFIITIPNCKGVSARSYISTSRTVSVMDSVSFHRPPILFGSLISTGLKTV